MDPTRDLADARLIRFLETEPVLWLSTVGPGGAPGLVPTWFVWDGVEIVIVSKPGARKVRNLTADPRAMIALGDPDDDFDVGMLHARATVIPPTAESELPAGFLAKYGPRIAGLGLTPGQFAATYSQHIRLTPTRALGWHGRSTPASIIDAARSLAASGSVSIMEPIRSILRPALGEPMGRLTRM